MTPRFLQKSSPTLPPPLRRPVRERTRIIMSATFGSLGSDQLQVVRKLRQTMDLPTFDGVLAVILGEISAVNDAFRRSNSSCDRGRRTDPPEDASAWFSSTNGATICS
jgi:hypothetical protein